jgi:hypothetical protein
MRRFVLVLGCLTVGVLALFVLSLKKLWSGHYVLSVTVVTSGEMPEWVYCVPVSASRDWAERRLEGMLNAPGEWADDDANPGVLAKPFRGQVLQTTITLDGSYSPIFGELNDDPRCQRLLIVVAEMPGGRRMGRVVDIPKDYKRTKAFEVSLP